MTNTAEGTPAVGVGASVIAASVVAMTSVACSGVAVVSDLQAVISRTRITNIDISKNFFRICINIA
jgi:hypothetical protein